MTPLSPTIEERTSWYETNGKRYEIKVTTTGERIIVNIFYRGEKIGGDYSMTTEVAQDFRTYRGEDPIDALIEVAQADLDAGEVPGQ